MINFLKDCLLNIFLIFSPLTIYPYLYKSQRDVLKYRVLITLFFSVAIVSAMLFPVNYNGLVYDFRSIPLLIGSLYGGIYVSLFLYVTTVMCRFFLGSSHNLIYAMSMLPTLLLVIWLLRRYRQLSLLHKIVSAVIVCVAIKVIVFLIYLSGTGQMHLFANNLLITFKTYILQSIVVAIFVYAMEFLQKYIHMQEEAIRGEKIRIVSEMAASVAHEIRNPLTAVRGFVQLLGAPNLEQEKKQFYKQIALEELNRAQSIINDYLAIAKPEPEKDELIDLNEEMHYISQVLLTLANYNDVKIEVSLQEGRMMIEGDRNKLRQSFLNIGKNAIEAMASSGGLLEIQSSAFGGSVVVTFRDSGIGMTQEQIGRLGTPYFSTKEKGTGLGTMVSFSLIKAMKGRIRIDSEKGRGTVFEITFPAVTLTPMKELA